MSEHILVEYCFFLFVWVWRCKIAHYTCGFGFVWFFVLGCFSVVVCVWGEGLFHTPIMDAMLGSVGVVWGMLTFLVELQVLVHICLFFGPKLAILKTGF